MIFLKKQKTTTHCLLTAEEVMTLYNSIFAKKDCNVRASKRSFEDILFTKEKTQMDYGLIHLKLKRMKSLELLAATPEQYEKLLKLVTLILSYKRLKEGSFVYKCGESRNDIFIMFKGTAHIIKALKRQVRMTEEEYMLYLTKLFYYKEKELLEKTVLDNNCIFNVSSTNFNSTIEFYLKKEKESNIFYNAANRYKVDEESIKLVSSHATSKKEFVDYFIYCLQSTLVVNHLRHENSISSIDEYIERIEPIYIPFSSSEERNNYETYAKKSCYIYQYEQADVITEGHHFGDNFSFTDPQTTTVIIREDAIIGKIHHSHSSTLMKEYIIQPAHVICRVILKNHIFSSLTMKTFTQVYLNYFSYHREYNGQSVIISEGKAATKVFFLKSGEYEIYSKKSIEQLTGLINNYKTETCFKAYNKDDSIYTNIPIEYAKNKYPMILSIITGSDVLGFYDYTMNDKYTFSVKMKSNTAEYFSIDTQALTDMCMNNPCMYTHMNEYMNTKRKILLDKLIVFREKFYQQYLLLNKKKETDRLIDNEELSPIIKTYTLKKQIVRRVLPQLTNMNITLKSLNPSPLKKIKLPCNPDLNKSQSLKRNIILQKLPIRSSKSTQKVTIKDEHVNHKQMEIETLHLDNQNQISIIKSPLIQSKSSYFKQKSINNDSFRKKGLEKEFNKNQSTNNVFSSRKNLNELRKQPIKLILNNSKVFTKQLNTLNDFWNHFGQS